MLQSVFESARQRLASNDKSEAEKAALAREEGENETQTHTKTSTWIEHSCIYLKILNN